MPEYTNEVLMAVGAAIWGIGEARAVYRAWKYHDDDTTTWYVRHFAKKWLWARILVYVFTIWLFLHFNFNMLP